jgi:hypothetical protein
MSRSDKAGPRVTFRGARLLRTLACFLHAGNRQIGIPWRRAPPLPKGNAEGTKFVKDGSPCWHREVKGG